LFELYGSGSIIIPVKSIPKILLKDIFNPFYIFQAFVIWWWWYIGYIYFDIIIAVITVGSIIIQVVDIRTNLINLSKMAFYEC